MQLKPGHGDQLYIINIPDDNLALRFFDGGMERKRIFCFDFVDAQTREATNSPSDYEIHALPNPHHMLNIPGPIISWEAAMNIPRNQIKKGEERFSVPEGTHCVLLRPGKPRFDFEAPERPRVLEQGIARATSEVLR